MRVGLFVIAALLVTLAVLAIAAATDVARFDVASLARRMPDRTALMRQREVEAMRAGRPYRTDVRTVSYDQISPMLRRAVLIAEDDAFYSHDGLDWNELQASARANLRRGRVVRGGSTITQQLAKNLFLGSERSLTRKLREAFLAIRLERALSKRRIFELYLNRIEWGDGIFGIEAAARHYFGVGAGALSTRQALLLAAVIINPVRYSVLAPPPRIERRVKMIADRLRRRGALDDREYQLAIGRAPAAPDWLQELLPSVTAPVPDTARDSSRGFDSTGAAADSAPH